MVVSFFAGFEKAAKKNSDKVELSRGAALGGAGGALAGAGLGAVSSGFRATREYPLRYAVGEIFGIKRPGRFRHYGNIARETAAGGSKGALLGGAVGVGIGALRAHLSRNIEPGG